MNTKLFLNDNQFLGGVTFKDVNQPEENNMALHTGLNQESVIENRKKLASLLGCSLQDFVFANQTHSSNFYHATSSDKGRGSESLLDAIMDTDALYTFEPNLVLSVFTADCVPVILYSEKDGLIAAIHSGWQGTVKEITVSLLEHLIEVEKCNPSNFQIYLGPAMSQNRFEVDEDVYLKFKNLGYADEFIYYKKETHKYHIDNQLTVKKQCEIMGVPSENVFIDKTCTYDSPNGFSYREDKSLGRHLSFIMRKATNFI